MRAGLPARKIFLSQPLWRRFWQPTTFPDLSHWNGFASWTRVGQGKVLLLTSVLTVLVFTWLDRRLDTSQRSGDVEFSGAAGH